MKKAVMYGAGNIGRGFIGKTFSESGYEVCFIDIDQEVVARLNIDRCYPVKIVSNAGQHEEIVTHVRAVSGMDMSAVAREITEADIMATAVGVNVLPKIVGPVCEGLKKRFKENKKPLNIIICENLIDADKYLRALIEEEMGTDYQAILDENIGLVEASIGRMVPIMTEEMKEGNILKVWVEPYDELPVDKAAFVGDIPEINKLIPFSPFGFYIKRKLFIHNMSHAMWAYLGWQKGYQFIDQCVEDDDIRGLVEAAMRDMAKALNSEYKVPIEQINDNVYDLLDRFGNKALGDTVSRVGRDPIRKLGRNDRLTGAALYCEAQGITTNHITKGIVAALRYDNVHDESAVKIQLLIKEHGIETCITQVCGLAEGSALFGDILKQYQSFDRA